jgi:hypothetical protein
MTALRVVLNRRVVGSGTIGWDHSAGIASITRILQPIIEPNDGFGVIRVGPTRSRCSRHVRYHPYRSQICASRLNDVECQQRTKCSAAKTPLLDHLVGEREQLIRHG